jgi:hypothetical protein
VDPEVLVRSFGVAWNAHDIDAVVAHFAPDAVVRQSTGVTVTVSYYASGMDGFVDLRDVFGARLTASPSQAPFAVEGGAAVWRGQTGVREWARLLFTLRHRAEVTGYATADGRVTWRYRAHVDPYQTIPGVPRAEGTAAATVRGGWITELSLSMPADRVAQREAALNAAAAAAVRRAGAVSGASASRSRFAGSPAPVPTPPDTTDASAPLTVAALGAAASAFSIVCSRTRQRAGPKRPLDGGGP